MKKISILGLGTVVVGGLLFVVFYLNKTLRLNSLNLYFAHGLIRILGANVSDLIEYRFEHDPMADEKIGRVILNLPSYGCTHYFEGSGCAMCGFNNEIKKYRIREFSSLFLRTIIIAILCVLDYEIQEENFKTDVLMVFMAGSFVNPNEMPKSSQDEVINYFAESRFKNLYIELRPEYVIKHRNDLKRITESIMPKNLYVALGFESVDDYVRNDLIKKCVSRHMFENAILELNKLGIKSYVYILVGAPFFSVREIEELAIASSLYVWRVGANIVNLEVYCVQADTEWGELFARKQLKPINLWSVFRIIKTINEVSSNWYLGKLSDLPVPVNIPKTCTKCRVSTQKAFDILVKDQDVSILNGLKECDCDLIQV